MQQIYFFHYKNSYLIHIRDDLPKTSKVSVLKYYLRTEGVLQRRHVSLSLPGTRTTDELLLFSRC